MKSRKTRATSRPGKKTRTIARRRAIAEDHSYVVEGGEATHVLVPIMEYERLVKASMVEKAIAQRQRGHEEFVDADDLALELAAQRIAEARKAAGVTQKQLGDRLKIPQSQISRIERNPDRTTVRTLKRIARALDVNVRSLL